VESSSLLTRVLTLLLAVRRHKKIRIKVNIFDIVDKRTWTSDGIQVLPYVLRSVRTVR
jgi:hypothetical protein